MPQTTLSDKALDHPASARWSLAARRRLVLCLNLVSILGLFLAMARIMAYGGVTPIEGAMLVAYALTLPWLTIGFWNAVIGLILTRVYSDPAAIVTPQLAQTDDDAPITSRTAIVMAIRNENPDDSLGRLEAMARDLGRSRYAEQFEYHVLSDTTRADIALEEERFVAQWRARARGAKIHYRRRLTNEGYKAGNVAEFLARCHQDYDFYLPLDADSLMGASAVERLVRVMQSDPKLGILQGLVVGTPSQTFFTRAFQFGMRNGMRSFTLGSAWWQGDCGPYWGHNALIRASAFHEYCQLPEISGRGALSGYILSHDQVEAVLMRRAGYECRVLAAEQESYEDNPPSMPDFIKRELRWCNGNLQYLRLGGLQGLKPLSRVQLWLAILMYVSPMAWIVFIALGASLAAGPQLEAVPAGIGLALFAVVMFFNLTPKIMGLAQILADHHESGRYGGRIRVLVGGVTELLLSVLTAPVVAFGITLFGIGLLFGQRISWSSQQRDPRRLLWREALAALWPQTLLGIGLAIYLANVAPWTLLFAAPVIGSLCLAIPVAVITTLPGLGRWSRRVGLFDIPEDRQAHLDGERSILPNVLQTTP